MSRRILPLALLAFWALSLSGLRAVPVLHEDESCQASPAYKLATQGVYSYGPMRIYWLDRRRSVASYSPQKRSVARSRLYSAATRA